MFSNLVIKTNTVLNTGDYQLCRSRRFCKETRLSKVFADANVPARLVATKKFLVILVYVRLSICCVLLRDKLLMGAFRSSRCNINRLVNEYIVNTCDWIATSMFHFGKCVTVFGFRRFLSSCLLLCVATDRSTQSIGRQTAIQFKLLVKNS